MDQNPLIFNLSSKIEYSKGGDFHSTATVELTGPTVEAFNLSSDLSQLVMRAILDAQDLKNKFANEDSSGGSSDIDSNAIKIILLSSKSVKFSDVAETAKKLFCQVGTYDGEVKIKPIFFNKISFDDYVRMVCEYCANFIIPSLFSAPE